MPYKRIPLMDKLSTREDYLRQLQDVLADSCWQFETDDKPRIRIKPKPGSRLQNHYSEIHSMYILGVPEAEKRREFCGIGIVTTYNVNGTEFLKSLSERRYREKTGQGSMHYLFFELALDTTEELITELSALEELIVK